MNFKVTSFLTGFNPLLPALNKLIGNRLPLLPSDPKTKIVFPKNQLKQFTKDVRNFVPFIISIDKKSNCWFNQQL